MPLYGLNGLGHGVFSRTGLWWYSGWYSTSADGSFRQEEILFCECKAGADRIVRISNPFGTSRVIAFDPQRDRVVMSQPMVSTPFGGVETNIYVTDASGNTPVRVQPVEGEVQTASVSPDGHWLLVSTLRTSSTMQKAVWLLPLEGVGDKPGSTQSYPAVRRVDVMQWPRSGAAPVLNAAFTPGDSSPAQVIVERIEGEIERLTIYAIER